MTLMKKPVEVCDKRNVQHDLIDVKVTESIRKIEISALISLAKSIKKAGFR